MDMKLDMRRPQTYLQVVSSVIKAMVLLIGWSNLWRIPAYNIDTFRHAVCLVFRHLSKFIYDVNNEGVYIVTDWFSGIIFV